MSHKKQGALPHYNTSSEMLSSSAEGLFWVVIFFMVILSSSCSKEPITEQEPPPADSGTIIRDLGNFEIPFWGRIETIDFDGDRFPEFIFEILPVGDGVNLLDKFCYNVRTTRFTSLPVNDLQEVPPVSYGIEIPLTDFKGYEWWPGNEITLFKKIVSQNGSSWWEGNWQDKEKKYLPFKVLRQDGVYAGWLEISTNTQTEKAIIHRAGISKKPNVAVKAGI